MSAARATLCVSARVGRRIACAWVLLLASLSPLAAQPADVLVVGNRTAAGSAEVVAAYQRLHGVSEDQVVWLELPPGAVVSRQDYERRIQQPIAEWLVQHHAQDRIRFIVLAAGLPLRIQGTAGRDGTAASVDSELALLYRRLTGSDVPVTGRVPNPYFHPDALGEDGRPFDRRHFDIYLVTRLDGASIASALGLLSRSANRPTTWRFVVDGRSPARSGAERRWLQEVPQRLAAVGPQLSVLFDESDAVLQPDDPLTGYFGWGSNDTGTRRPPVRFGPGAIAASFMSADARTLEPPPEGWQPGRWEQQETFYAGSPEALAGDWLDAGLTGLAANVSEAYLDGAIRPATLFEAWARGYTLAESFYLAIPFLSWQTVVFGDPLARAVNPSWSDPETPGMDTATNLPEAFLERRVAALVAGESTLTPPAARLWLRAQRLFADGSRDEARPVLEQASVAAPSFAAAHLLLAELYEATERHDLARSRYEMVLGLQRYNVIALNNLAYSLAVHENDVESALPIAERALRAAPEAPAVLDTVGWVWHLAGRHTEAVEALQKATAGDPSLCEAWEHLAAALGAVARRDEAAEAATRGQACRDEASGAAAADAPPGR